MMDIKKVQEEAKKEYQKERADRAKLRIKAKMKEIADAKQVVKNLEREYEDLLEEISDEQ